MPGGGALACDAANRTDLVVRRRFHLHKQSPSQSGGAQLQRTRYAKCHRAPNHFAIAPCFRSISSVRSIGRASTVRPRPVIVAARKRELYTASSVASITARNNGEIPSFETSFASRGV